PPCPCSRSTTAGRTANPCPAASATHASARRMASGAQACPMSAEFTIPYGYNEERGTFPSYADNRHLATFGATRSGKGATVIVQALLEIPHSVVVVDPKGQNAAITARQRREMGQDVFVLNPFGMHGGAPWHLPRHRYNP